MYRLLISTISQHTLQVTEDLESFVMHIYLQQFGQIPYSSSRCFGFRVLFKVELNKF